MMIIIIMIIKSAASLAVVPEKGSVEVLGDDRLAFKGQPVLFECRAAGWHPQPALEWQVGKEKVRTAPAAITIIFMSYIRRSVSL